MAHRTTTKRLTKPKANAWFVSIRGSYLPVKTAGWLVYLPYLAYLVFSLVVALRETASLGVAILIIIPNWVAAAATVTYVAARKS